MNFDDIMLSSITDLDDIISPNDTFTFTEDIYNKTEFEQDFLSNYQPIDIFSNIIGDEKKCSTICYIHHDCMWTGLCGSKEHNHPYNITDDVTTLKGINLSPITTTTTTKSPLISNFNGSKQQSLLKTSIKTVNPYNILPKLETETITPPISDDEETKSTPTVQQILHDVIYENIIEDDSDLSDYFREGNEIDDLINNDTFDDDEDEEEEDEEEEEYNNDNKNEQEENKARLMAQLRAYQKAAESDHSYHKGNNCMQNDNLGIDTPSDSEEEIDVVSLGDKWNSIKCNVVGNNILPTNPSKRDRHNLQRTMHSRFPNGIKTILPLRKIQQISSSPSSVIKRTTITTTGRRSKQCSKNKGSFHHQRLQFNNNSSKRRTIFGHSSDSEQEPSEKRSLHNNMERQRRIDLRNLFEDLKSLVPEVNKKQRAAKVLILRGAAQYCRNLTNTSNGFNRQLDELKRQQERLKAKVSQLRRKFASNR